MNTLATSENGAWHSITIEPPLLLQPGDKLRQIGSQILQERNGTIVAIRDIGVSQEFEPELTGPQNVSQAVFFRRTHMAGIAISLVDVQTTGNSVLASFSDGTQRETDLTSLIQNAASINQNTELAKDLLLAILVSKQPTLNDANAITGSMVSIDMAASTPVAFNLTSNV